MLIQDHPILCDMHQYNNWTIDFPRHGGLPHQIPAVQLVTVSKQQGGAHYVSIKSAKIDIITRLSFDTGWNFSDLQLTVMWLAIQSRSIMVGGYYYKYACVRVRRSMAQGSCLANQMKCLPKFKCVFFLGSHFGPLHLVGQKQPHPALTSALECKRACTTARLPI